jgi:biotin carboxyl carrier protein
MSAFPSSPRTSPPPPPVIPVVTPPEAPAPPSRWPVYTLVALLALGAAWFLRPKPQARPAVVVIPTARAYRGTVEPTRRVAGSITAGRFANVAAPVLQAPDQGRGLTLTYLASSGTHVRKGQMIAQIDAQDIKDHLDDVEANIVQSALDIKRRKAQLIAQMEGLRQSLRMTKATLDKAIQNARATEVSNPLQQEVLKLAVDEYQEAYDEAVKQLPLMEERQLADIKLYELNYEHDIRHRQHHQDDFRHCTIEAPMDGMVVMQTTYRGGEMNQIKVGDRLSPGQPFMAVVDPASMQLDAMMSQAESELVHLGQRATVHFDAFPDIVVKGHVKAVGTYAMGGRRLNYYIRRIPVRVKLDTADSRVIPDLSASADLITAAPAEGVVVPREAVAQSGGKNVVYVKEGADFLPHEVEIATGNNTHVAVSSGLSEGQEVALQVPPAAAALH